MEYQQRKRNHGFTLIELLIAIAIIGILAAVAYPSYTGVLEKTRRQEAVRTLLEASQMMESYYAMNLDYSGAIAGGKVTSFTVNDDFSDYYQLTAVATKSTFTLSATPISTSAQSSDKCGTLTITQTGSTSAATTDCW
ncbi:prepilin-type N-terminal cleavage/methylation domain-containing protein [Psychromonas sp. RZ22]|uniref:type IV pilin protein n=1 Tax=Psychromonas algarum TaxID=2555643 RepID=UPI0010675781|nr:type IV pilin protein [Psychromonas sp. RZ22]TEW56782.1 prepilin-type N-terminal cleavage/methylation domain-containing protein [Psychromonas sp. RZ22]